MRKDFARDQVPGKTSATMRGGPLHSARLGYRRKTAARLIIPAVEARSYDFEEIRSVNLRAGIASATSTECPCGLERAHKTGATGCELCAGVTR